MKSRERIFLVCLLVTVVGLRWLGLALAEYPERPITMICPYGASGGTADTSLRPLCKHAENTLGQPIAVINKPGASGSLAAGTLAAAHPDGYTLGMVTFGPLTMSPHMYDINYDPFTSFDFILAFGKYMYGPAVRSDSPFKTLKDMINYAKAHPGKVKYSTVGLATPTHTGMVQLGKLAGVKWEVVVFKKASDCVTACLGGHVEVISQTPAAVVPPIKAGQLRLLASMSDTRWPWVPEVPTVRELGYDFDVVSWLALAAPRGTPRPIMDKLTYAFKKALDDQEFIKIMDRIYVPVVYRTANEFKKLVDEGYKDMEKMILDLGLHKSQKK